MRDYWRPQHAFENSLYTAPFTKAFFARGKAVKHKVDLKSSSHFVRLQLRAPRIGRDYQMAVVGSTKSLGAWDESKAVLMSDEDFPVWKVDIPASAKEVPFEYKFVIYSHKEGRVVTWEGGDNRYFPLYTFSKESKLIVHSEEFFHYPVGNWKTAGVAIPVFSLRSKEGSGVGEFTDIKKLVDWSVKTGLKVVQILPVNDTVATHTWVDSYPYAAISVEALHPIYANLQSMGKLKDKKVQSEIDEKEAARLNALPEVDYEGVMKLKTRFFKLSFEEKGSCIFEELRSSRTFSKAMKTGCRITLHLATYRDKHGTLDFTQWGSCAEMSSDALETFVDPKAEALPGHCHPLLHPVPSGQATEGGYRLCQISRVWC